MIEGRYMLDFGFYNMDCMEGMKQFPDKYFDLAIVDPPYGDGGGSGQAESDLENDLIDTDLIHRGGGTTHSDSERRTRITRTGGTWAAKFSKKS